MPGPLDGIRILDFTRYQQGPYATVLLSDLGADVIKVEERITGDLGRSLSRGADGFSGYFEAHDRNKRSITLDVRKPAGLAIAHRLVQEVDVVVDNFRPGVMKRLKLDYDTLVQINPLIITGSASGFGPEGPGAGEPSFDIIGQAIGGIMSNQGGGPDRPPMAVVSGTADQVGAMVFALGICSAIVARERMGFGQHVDASLLGSQIALQAMQYTGFLHSRRQVATAQHAMPLFTYYQCGDGKGLAIGLLDPRWWAPLCLAMERDELLTDERFDSPVQQHRNREALVAELARTFKTRPRDEWLAILKAHDLPCGPVNDYAAAAAEPQVRVNHYVTTLPHPQFGEIEVAGSPIRMTRTPVGPRHVAPELGEHTDEILAWLGYSAAQIAQLRADEVV